MLKIIQSNCLSVQPANQNQQRQRRAENWLHIVGRDWRAKKGWVCSSVTVMSRSQGYAIPGDSESKRLATQSPSLCASGTHCDSNRKWGVNALSQAPKVLESSLLAAVPMLFVPQNVHTGCCCLCQVTSRRESPSLSSPTASYQRIVSEKQPRRMCREDRHMTISLFPEMAREVQGGGNGSKRL